MQTFVIIWTPGPNWIEGVSLYDQPYIEDHADHLDQLMQENRILLNGPFTSKTTDTTSPSGMTVVRAEDEARFHARLAADPALVNHVLTAQMRFFHVVIEGKDDATPTCTTSARDAISHSDSSRVPGTHVP